MSTPLPTVTRTRIAVVGHVDHGKSTVVGRLLHETGALAEGRLAVAEAAAKAEGVAFEWAFLLDALLEEQAQNVTIDITHAHFRSGERLFEVIDCPGHVEFLRNMVTGAASADAALLVVSAPDGVGEQTRRHAALVPLVGITEAVVAVNKMDAVGWAREVFEAVAADAQRLLEEGGVRVRAVVPLAAREGANLTAPAAALAWHAGPTLLGALEGLEPPRVADEQPLRFSVQAVYRQEATRVLAGKVLGGVVRPGDRVLFVPGGKEATVREVRRWPETDVRPARTGDCVGLVLAEPLFLERGAVACTLADAPCEFNRVRGRVFWLGEAPLAAGTAVEVRLGSQAAPATVVDVSGVWSATPSGEAGVLARNQVADVVFHLARTLVFDVHAPGLETGRFVVVRDGRIEGGGTVLPGAYFRRTRAASPRSGNLSWTHGKVGVAARETLHGHRGHVVWFTGLPAAGKSTLATALEAALHARRVSTLLLDGDNLRHGLCADLGFDAASRRENVRRAAEVARLVADAGVVCIVALIAPFREERERARQAVGPARFTEVYVATPLDVCRARDPKGLYARAERGEIADFTGVSSPYEAPEGGVVVNTATTPVAETVRSLVDLLAETIHLP